jgi:hypothetical protein
MLNYRLIISLFLILFSTVSIAAAKARTTYPLTIILSADPYNAKNTCYKATGPVTPTGGQIPYEEDVRLTVPAADQSSNQTVKVTLYNCSAKTSDSLSLTCDEQCQKPVIESADANLMCDGVGSGESAGLCSTFVTKDVEQHQLSIEFLGSAAKK